MKLRSILRLFPALAALAPLGVAAASFGRFGETLGQAKTTHFFTWFHLEQTAAEGGSHVFQPSGAKFHDLVKVAVKTRSDDSIGGMTLAVKRTFIDGVESPFARDIAKSFLDGAITEVNADVKALINQIWHSPSVGRVVIRHEGAPQPELPATPTPAYRVFLGQDLRWSMSGNPLRLTLDNRDGWLYITVVA